LRSGTWAGAAGEPAGGGEALVEEKPLAQLDRFALSRRGVGGVARDGDRPGAVREERLDFGFAELHFSRRSAGQERDQRSGGHAGDGSSVHLAAIIDEGDEMSVKSDKWIRRMAAKGMIEPFEAGQVKELDGKRVVSYGTSSYGYDIRCSAEFKIFTNINSTIVDPKHFDEKNFVDYRGDVCIIPPNSFALARTVEYFRIPRNVLTICLGKVNLRALRGSSSTSRPWSRSGRARDPGVLQHHAATRPGLRQRRACACDLHRVRRGLQNLLQDRGGKYQGQKGVTLPRI
jgi:dCTP deaminase